MDLYVEIVFDEGANTTEMSKALREIQAYDVDFLWPEAKWWHKPAPMDPRGYLARVFSRHGLKGKLSVEEHDGKSLWNVPPKPRWTGFTPSQKK